MTTQTRSWLDNAILQSVAESYLHMIPQFGGSRTLDAVLDAGVNNLDLNPDGQGATRLTTTQITWFKANYEIVTHYPNDPSGFSATLFKNKTTGEYTLSLRSTEYQLAGKGGDYERDGVNGTDGEISQKGFALAQLSSMEEFYARLKNGEVKNPVTGQWGSDPAAQQFASALTGGTSTLNVTGYSLGAHLATAFTLMHGADTQQTYTYNAAGVGAVGLAIPTGQDITGLIDLYRNMMAWDGQGIPPWYLGVSLKSSAAELTALQQAALAEPNGVPVGTTNVYLDAKHQATMAVLAHLMFPAGAGPSVTTLSDGMGDLQIKNALDNWWASNGDGPLGKDPNAFSSSLYTIGAWGSEIKQFYGHGEFFDPQAVANSGYHAPASGIWIEDLPVSRAWGILEMLPIVGDTQLVRDLVGDFGETHSITPIIDSLTVLDLLQGLDSSTDNTRFTQIMKAMSNRVDSLNSVTLQNAAVAAITSIVGFLTSPPLAALSVYLSADKLYDADAMENFINALTRIFTGTQGTLTPKMKTDGSADPLGYADITSRNALHAAIEAIRASTTYQQSAGLVQIQALSTVGATDMATRAKTDIGYRYALKELLPFAITGDEGLYAQHNATGSLDYYNAVTGTGNLTDAYLKDRADMLTWKIKFDYGKRDIDDLLVGLGDKQYDDEWDSNIADNWEFIDRKTQIDGQPLTLKIDGQGAMAYRQIVFGSDLGESDIEGGGRSDRLYGGGGADTLTGNGGNDYLEGGQGFDTYVINAGDGYDTVLDSDGLGVIKIGGVDAKGSTGIDPAKWIHTAGSDTWVDQQNGITYSRSVVAGETRLLVKKGTSTVLVRGWSDNELGIQLGDGAVPMPAATALTLTGDLKPLDTDLAQSGIQAGYDSLGNLLTDGTVQAHQDILYGTAGNDLLQGFAGTDYLAGFAGDDRLEGGLDADVLAGGQGDDHLYGGDGNDILLGDHDLQLIPNSYDLTRNANLVAVHTVTLVNGAAQHGYQLSIGSSIAAGAGGADLIDGGQGDDLIMGGGGDDQINGGDGADVVFGEGGRDIIEGGTGNDILVGDSYGSGTPYGDDYINGGDGDDWLYGTGGNDIVDGGAGNDVLFGDGNDTADDGEDILMGGDGNDSLYGGGKNDILIGGAGDDILRGEDGDDILIGGDGADTLIGGAGNDTYLDVTAEDTIDDGEGSNTIHLATGAGQGVNGITSSAFNTADGAGMQINLVLDTGSTLQLRNGFFGNGTTIQFANGDALDLEMLAAESIATPLSLALGDNGGRVFGGAGGDALFGGAGNDTLAGHKGNDILQGDLGDDVYTYDLGDGRDTIIETGGDADVLRFSAGILPGDIRLTRTGGSDDGLLLERLDADRYLSGDAVHLKNYFQSADGSSRVERIEFADGTVWTYETIQARMLASSDRPDVLDGYAGADFIDGLGGDDSINGKAGDDVLQGGDGDDDLQGGLGNDTLLGGAGNDRLLGYGSWLNDTYAANNDAGNDILYGGAGNDRMFGGQGNDTYLFGRGDGYDYVGDEPNKDGTPSVDVLRLGSGVLPQHVTVHRVRDSLGSDDLLLVIDGTNTQIFLSNYFSIQDYQIERIEFDNGAGPVWTAVEINANVQAGTQNSMLGTSGNDVFIVDHELDTITESANAGTDTVLASRRFTLPNNVENLSLTGFLNIDGYGNSLDNTLLGNSGDNILVGNGGYDIAYGGLGNDTYQDVDQIVELPDEGIDTIVNVAGGVLPANVENLFMHGTIGYRYYNVSAIGNELDNILTSSGQGIKGDILDGRGGADTMIIKGMDEVIVYVDNPGDRIIGTPYEIRSTLDYSLSEPLPAVYGSGYAPNSAPARLTLLGSNAISGRGNILNNVLDGMENTAANMLIGGKGDDYYRLGIEDTAIELDGEGYDTVEIYADADINRPPISYDMSSNSIEKVILTGYQQGSVTGSDKDDYIVGNDASNTLWGQAGNDVLEGRGGQDTLVGGVGDDLYYADGGDIIIENPDEGYDTIVFPGNPYLNPFGNVMAPNTEEAYSLGVNVNIKGNDGSNYIRGDNGYNQLDGGLGADVLEGGYGSDTYVVDDILDVVIENANEGYDRVLSRVNYTLGSHVENLTLIGDEAISGTGNELSNFIEGNSSNNLLNGLDGDDWLDGGAGDDILRGGKGSDTYYFGVGGGMDVIEDLDEGSGGVDRLMISDLPENVLVRRVGNDISLRLNALDQVIVRWDAGAGAGIEYVEFYDGTVWDAQTLLDKSVNHAPLLSAAMPDQAVSVGAPFSYVVPDNTFTDVDAGELLTYSAVLSNGNPLPAWLSFDPSSQRFSGVPDTAASISIRVAVMDSGGLGVSDDFNLNATVQNQTLTGTSVADTLNGGAGNDTLSGLAGNDVLNGGAGDDYLDGGTGNNTMKGGAGNDTYIVNSTSDIVTENLNEGTDLVNSSVTYTLAANVENLTLTGTSAINGTGNALDNILVGNSAVNTLTGGAGNDRLDGKGGADKMFGGTGDDTYVVERTTDVVTEYANEGIDTIESSVTLTLRNNVENLTLTGTSAINGTGNTLNNVLKGNSAANKLTGAAGNDTLDGMGGTDTLTGGTGNDTYIMGRGYGTDTVAENDSTKGNTDVAQFLSGVAADQIWFKKATNNLEVSIIGTSDKLVIKDWYRGNAYHVEQFKTTDGAKTLTDSNVQNLVNAMASFAPPAAGQTTLPSNYQTTLAPVIAANWQ